MVAKENKQSGDHGDYQKCFMGYDGHVKYLNPRYKYFFLGWYFSPKFSTLKTKPDNTLKRVYSIIKS